MLNQLVADADGGVRAAAVGALSGGYRDDAALLRWIAGLFAQDPDPEVQAACVAALSLAHHNGLGDVSLGVFEAALQLRRTRAVLSGLRPTHLGGELHSSR